MLGASSRTVMHRSRQQSAIRVSITTDAVLSSFRNSFCYIALLTANLLVVQTIQVVSLSNMLKSIFKRARSRALHYSTQAPKPSFPTSLNSTKHPAVPHQARSSPSFNLFREVRHARPAVRYTVYAGLGLMATVETTFWLKVIKAKFFPSKVEDQQDEADELLENLRGALAEYKATWMTNYGRYYGGYVWGIGER